MNFTPAELERYVDAHFTELLDLIRALCAISAPSWKEQDRAAFCRQWLLDHGADAASVLVDPADNVILELNAAGKDQLSCFSAHTDTVFPDLEPMPFREADGKFLCPGVYDDTTNLAVLLMCAAFFLDHGVQPRRGMLVVADSGEEGLGNLRGCRQLMEEYQGRVADLVSFDLTYHELYHRAVGSTRYRVTVRTKGGHSFFNFGEKNAIAQLSRLITTLYDQTIPTDGESRTTFNVGLIEGGTSVNTIAQNASMLYEYRSDSAVCLAAMEESFRKILADFPAEGTDIDVELLGTRPCAGDVDMAKQEALTKLCAEIVERHTGKAPTLRSGSTDCNIPLSLGIPAVSFGVCNGKGAHTREEWMEVASLRAGFLSALELMLHSAEN